MAKRTNPGKGKKKQILMKMDAELAADIQRLSEASGSSPRNVVAGLVWLGKKMFGREVVLKSKTESKSLSVHVFEEYTKLSSLEDL